MHHEINVLPTSKNLRPMSYLANVVRAWTYMPMRGSTNDLCFLKQLKRDTNRFFVAIEMECNGNPSLRKNSSHVQWLQVAFRTNSYSSQECTNPGRFGVVIAMVQGFTEHFDSFLIRR